MRSSGNIDKMLELAEQLRRAGKQIADEDIFVLMLISFPGSYENKNLSN